MGTAVPLIRPHIPKTHLQILAPLTQHVPHRFGLVPVQIHKNRVRKMNFRMVAGNHTLVVSLLKRFIEFLNKFLIAIQFQSALCSRKYRSIRSTKRSASVNICFAVVSSMTKSSA